MLDSILLSYFNVDRVNFLNRKCTCMLLNVECKISINSNTFKSRNTIFVYALLHIYYTNVYMYIINVYIHLTVYGLQKENIDVNIKKLIHVLSGKRNNRNRVQYSMYMYMHIYILHTHTMEGPLCKG